MASTIKLKQSSVAGKAPTTTDLSLGELAVNTTDGKLYLKKNVSGTESVVEVGAGAGTVTSVGVSVPTGLSVSGTPVTSSGTIAISLASGYSIPTNASQTNWNSAYTERLQWDGGSTSLVAATARTSLGGTTAGQSFFTLTNPSAITFPRINANNTVSALDAATFRTAIGAGTGSGTVTGVTGTSPISSSGGTAPTISLATAYGDTKNPYASKSSNYVLAAPNGSNGVPTFRALASADLPALTSGSSIVMGDGSGKFASVTVGSGLTFSGGTLSASASGSSGSNTLICTVNFSGNSSAELSGYWGSYNLLILNISYLMTSGLAQKVLLQTGDGLGNWNTNGPSNSGLINTSSMTVSNSYDCAIYNGDSSQQIYISGQFVINMQGGCSAYGSGVSEWSQQIYISGVRQMSEGQTLRITTDTGVSLFGTVSLYGVSQ